MKKYKVVEYITGNNQYAYKIFVRRFYIWWPYLEWCGYEYKCWAYHDKYVAIAVCNQLNYEYADSLLTYNRDV